LKNVPERFRAETLGDVMDLYLAADVCPVSAKRNLPGVFKRFAELVSSCDDPYQVSIWQAGGLLNAWEQDIEQRQLCGELRKASADNYRSWGKKAIYWAAEHVLGRDAHTPVDILIELDPQQHRLLEWLKANGSKPERQMVRRFFLWLGEQEKGLSDLGKEGDVLTKGFACEHLACAGIQSWRKAYANTRRGLSKLQQTRLLPPFEMYRAGLFNNAYIISWQKIPNKELHGRAETYFRVACDEQAFEERSGRVVSTGTRDGRLGVLGRYVGFLVKEHGCDISGLSIEDIFSRAWLKAFVVFLQDRQDGRLTGGVEGSLNQLKQFAVSFLNIPKDRFDKLVDGSRIERKSKTGRVPTLEEYHIFIDALHQRASDLGAHRTVSDQMGVFRLHCMLVVLNDCPLRAKTLCKLKLAHHVLKEPLTGLWRIELSADDVKGKRPFAMTLSEYSQSVLDHYMTQVRPTILGDQESEYLFATRSGHHIKPTFFSKQVSEWDACLREVALDQAMTPHRVRDMVSRACVTFLPNRGSVVAQALLQHASLRTLDEHYLDAVGRSEIQRNERLGRWVDKETITEDDVQKIIAEVRGNGHQWERFRKALRVA